MKNRKTEKCGKTVGKFVLIGILIAIANRLTQSEKEKSDYMERRKERHKEWTSGRKAFSDEERDIW